MINFDNIEDAINAIKNGEMLVVLDDEDRENEGDLVMAAELITPADINFMAKEGRGLICAPLSLSNAKRLGFNPMVSKSLTGNQCNFTVSVDYNKNTTTGISASDRAKTVRAIVDKKSVANDFDRPGHVFPLIAKDGGVLVRAGHTEASVDFVKLAGFSSDAAVICEIADDDGEMMRRDDLIDFAKKHDLKIVSIKDLIEYRRKNETFVELVAESKLPTKYGVFDMKVYRSLLNDDEHVVLSMGAWSKEDDVLLRVHSECLTGEVFHSMRCDCGAQLDFAMEEISKLGVGVLLYLRGHEGRGIGLANKVKAYHLQDNGCDTVEANEKLGFKADLREYGIGAQILVDLGLHDIRLMTNNPAKIVGIEGYDLSVVERVAIELPANDVNKRYLKTKKDRMGHFIEGV